MNWFRKVLHMPKPAPDAVLPKVESTRGELDSTASSHHASLKRADDLARFLDDYRKQDGALVRKGGR